MGVDRVCPQPRYRPRAGGSDSRVVAADSRHGRRGEPRRRRARRSRRSCSPRRGVEGRVMAAVRLRLVSELRSRWKGWLAMGALAGLFAGAVIAAGAGARRTETSYQRFLVAERAPDILVFSPPNADQGNTFASFSEADLARVPEVAEVASAKTIGVAHPPEVNIVAPADTKAGSVMLRRKMLAGREPR